MATPVERDTRSEDVDNPKRMRMLEKENAHLKAVARNLKLQMAMLRASK